MKIRKRLNMTSDMSMTSMSDIAFLLIIFFMVASAFILKDGLHLILPDKSRKPLIVQSKDVITITLSRDETILFNKRPMRIQDIRAKLVQSMKEKKESIVLLRIDKKVRYNTAIDIIDIIRMSGVTRLSLKMI